jgi:hypothetical protein
VVSSRAMWRLPPNSAGQDGGFPRNSERLPEDRWALRHNTGGQAMGDRSCSRLGDGRPSFSGTSGTRTVLKSQTARYNKD